MVRATLLDGFYLFGPHDIRVEGEDGVLSTGFTPPVGYDSFDSFSGRGYASLDYGVSDTVSAYCASEYLVALVFFFFSVYKCIYARVM